ncbi:hypothetical protein DS745_07955 [Anaerobacillus alkaliphilus]|uniref:Uncharacterized protein n=1 Tax=Anaerobacillus alkaliphilus TaxID=1548597 RepID=A0A4Q0VWR9_9BACI|nr:hypothetical protein [Anaerobacillus alkaliphilus]RXJ02018.1 hypothetical protein DS745_07955 [Anaerobacillus alkaliphilus]
MNIEFLPDIDQKTYEKLTQLSLEEKRTLWRLIQHTSKDGYVLCRFETEKMKLLEQKGFIQRNEFFRGRELSFFVLPSAQQLLKELRKKVR